MSEYLSAEADVRIGVSLAQKISHIRSTGYSNASQWQLLKVNRRVFEVMYEQACKEAGRFADGEPYSPIRYHNIDGSVTRENGLLQERFDE